MHSADPAPTKRPWHGCRLAAVVLATLASPAPAVAQAMAESHGDWVVQCADASNQEFRCQIAQTLTADGTGQHVMTMIVRRDEETGGLTALVRLPHGLFLPAGIALQVDGGAPVRAAIQTSDASGVYASVPLTAVLAGAMKAGRSMSVAMQSVKREPIALTVSLTGFTAASATLAARAQQETAQ